MMKKSLMLCVLGCLVQPVWAGSIDNIGGLSQSEFKLFSEDMGSVVSYKPVSPSEPLGVLGFDLGLEFTSTTLQHKDLWKTATSGVFTSSSVIVPKLHAHLGLPLNFDVGAFISSVPDTNIKVFGGEVRYAFVEGGTAIPAIAVRGSMSKVTGVDQLSLNTKGLDVSISKGFAMFTPYAGIGNVWVDSTPNVSGMSKESFTQSKFFVGGNLNLGLVNFDLEYDKTGSAQSYSVKAGFRF